jgi:HK97 family phage major capsid protein
MNREQMIARMEAILAAAEAEGRGMTDEEQSEFNTLKARVDGLDATTETRRDLAALRQQTGMPERVERSALRPDQGLAALFNRPSGDTRRMGDLVRAQLGMSNIRADQQLGTGSKGGFTAPDHVSAEVLDLARAKARVIAAGARTIPIAGATSFATVESDPAISNHAENAAIDETEVLFGARFFKPYTAVALCRASIELIEDAANFNDVLENTIAAAFAVEIDRRALYGNGIGGQLGLLNDADIAEIDGSTFSTWGPFSRAYQAVRGANYTPGAFIASPGVMGAIDGLVEGGGSNQPLRRPPSLEATSFLDTTSIPDEGSPAASVAVTGQWDQYFICTRTPITIEATRTGGDSFNKLSVLCRAYARLDSFAVRKSAFAKVTGIPVPVIA